MCCTAWCSNPGWGAVGCSRSIRKGQERKIYSYVQAVLLDSISSTNFHLRCYRHEEVKSFYLTDTFSFFCDHLLWDALLHSVEQGISRQLNGPCCLLFIFTHETEALGRGYDLLSYQNNLVVEPKLGTRFSESWISDCSSQQAKVESPFLIFHPLVLILP